LSFESISPKILALIFAIAAVAIIFALLGSSARNLFSGSITDEAIVIIKQGDNCIVEGGDEIPRTITDCSYSVNDTVLITYKAQQPAIEKHEIKQWFIQEIDIYRDLIKYFLSFISICSNRKKIELNDLFICWGALEDEDLSLRNSIFNFYKVYLILN